MEGFDITDRLHDVSFQQSNADAERNEIAGWRLAQLGQLPKIISGGRFELHR